MDITFLKSYPSNKFLFSMLIISILAVFVDLEISNIADFVKRFLISNSGFLTFASIVSIFWVTQLVFYYSIRDRLKVIKFMGKKLLLTEKLFRISLWLLLILNFIMLIETIAYNQYSVYILILIMIISYSFNAFYLGLLSFLLFTWNKTKRNNVLFSYSLATMFGSISAILTMIYITSIILGKTEYISANSEIVFPVYELNSYLGLLNISNTLFFICSFIFMWIGSSTVLKHYLSKIPKTRYILLISAPLVYYIGQYFTVLNIAFPFIDSSSTTFIYYYSMFFTLSSVVGSVIFAMSFWLIAKDLKRNRNISTYLTICGYGFMMFFSSATATIIHTPYPAFGIVSISLVGLSSYYILYGIYSSSVSLSEDISLRDYIRKSASSQLKFLTSISKGYLEDKIINQVFETTEKYKQDVVEKTGISSSLSKDEIKMYIRQVMDEIRSEKGIDKNSNTL